MLINSFNYDTNILISDINNFVHVSIKTLKYGYYYFQKKYKWQKN